jgi:hypothetical protein
VSLLDATGIEVERTASKQSENKRTVSERRREQRTDSCLSGTGDVLCGTTRACSKGLAPGILRRRLLDLLVWRGQAELGCELCSPILAELVCSRAPWRRQLRVKCPS